MMSHSCEQCGVDLPPSRAGRRFCGDACRKRASRSGPEMPPADAEDGPVTAAVRLVLLEVGDAGSVDSARAQMALALARLVDTGSVPAARELRGVLEDLARIENADVLAFRTVVQTPRFPSGWTDGGEK